jgi:hypothetical protein
MWEGVWERWTGYVIGEALAPQYKSLQIMRFPLTVPRRQFPRAHLFYINLALFYRTCSAMKLRYSDPGIAPRLVKQQTSGTNYCPSDPAFITVSRPVAPKALYDTCRRISYTYTEWDVAIRNPPTF